MPAEKAHDDRARNATSSGDRTPLPAFLHETSQPVATLDAAEVTPVDDDLTRPLDAARSELHAALEELRATREELSRHRAEFRTANRAVEMDKRRYEDLFRTAPDGYLVTDRYGTIRDANDAASTLLGCRRAHLLGKPVFVFLPLDERRELRHTLLRLNVTGASLTLPLSFGRQKGFDAVDLEARIAVSSVVHGDVELRWALRDLTERRQTEFVEQERRRLEQENHAKDEFISFLTHELRTPLTIIIGNTEALVRHSGLDEATRLESIEEIRKESKRIHHVVESLLFLAVTNQSSQFEPDFVMLQRLISSAIKDHRKQHPDREIQCRAGDELTPVRADPVYCEQILQNLLTNAEKYGDPGTPIEIELDEDGQDARVRVLDRGIGIGEDEADRLFNLFERGREVLQTPGAGIGLAVCKRLVEMQGGTIWAKPRDGGGSEFGFSLPLAERDAGE